MYLRDSTQKSPLYFLPFLTGSKTDISLII
jgi:hypothetical protein